MRSRSGRGGPSPIQLLQLTSFVSTFDRFAMPPMLVVIAHDLGVPLGQIVHAAGAYFLAYGLTQPVWGIVSDSLGRVRTMRLTLLVAGLMTIGSAFAMTPVVLGVARGLAGGFFGSAYPNSLIYLGDTVPAQRRQVEVTRLMVGVALGTAAASVGAGALAELFSWRAAFVVTGVAALVLVVALRSLPEPPRAPRGHPLAPLGVVVRSGTARLVLVLAFAEGAVLLGVLTLLPSAVQATGASSTVAGAVTGVYGLAVFGSARLVGRLSRSWHPARLIALGGTAALLACAVLAVSQAPGVAVVVAVLLGLAWAAMHSSLQTWATEVVPDARAAVVSLFAGSLFVGSAAAAVAVADLADGGRYTAIFVATAVLAVPLAVLATWGRSRWRRPGEATA
ncbi:MFS transporter [Nocardioides panacis]|uniref:MFS transporter n=1 Tax=Nocardioides panacis TaxID=2849501 RepID=A0A975XZ88_9ACTN|nr:MFS transporter [Nocardioides panacis]QWZ07133.1 MFS transporter [Nocardioides panacis]